jgi:hypothetical protein
MGRRRLTESDLAEWIEAELLAPPVVTRLRVYHTSGDKAELIHKLAPGADLDGKVRDESVRLAAELWGRAKAHADSFDGEATQRYKVVSESKAGRRGQWAWSVSPPVRSSNVGLSEPATPQGLLQALMRSNDQKDRALVDMATAVFEPMKQTIEALQRQNDALQRNRFDNLEAMADIQTKRHEHETEMVVLMADEERKEKLMSRLVNEVLPAVIGHVSKHMGGAAPAKKIAAGPASEKPLDQSERDRIRSILENLPAPQASALMSTLSDTDADFLMGLIQAKAAE